MKVFVYYNIRKKVWSLKALEGPQKGRVMDHAFLAMLVSGTFKVSEAGRQRVLRDKRKNVHAGVEGYLMDYCTDLTESRPWSDVTKSVALNCVRTGNLISYNPYKGPNFVTQEGHKANDACSVFFNADSSKVFARGVRINDLEKRINL